MTRRNIIGHVMRVGGIVLWAALVMWGGVKLLNYESAPGTPGEPPAQWPRASRIIHPPDKFTLVMLVHPNCPCTRASLAELEVLMARVPGRLAAWVVFTKPEATEAEIKASGLWKTATQIPGVSALFDEEGAETERFGGQVSGQTMLYDPNGRLVFSGGVTSGRGHQGENAGLDAVVLRVRGATNTPARVAVFGCALHNPGAKELSENSWTKR